MAAGRPRCGAAHPINTAKHLRLVFDSGLQVTWLEWVSICVWLLLKPATGPTKRLFWTRVLHSCILLLNGDFDDVREMTVHSVGHLLYSIGAWELTLTSSIVAIVCSSLYYVTLLYSFTAFPKPYIIERVFHSVARKSLSAWMKRFTMQINTFTLIRRSVYCAFKHARNMKYVAYRNKTVIILQLLEHLAFVTRLFNTEFYTFMELVVILM